MYSHFIITHVHYHAIFKLSGLITKEKKKLMISSTFKKILKHIATQPEKSIDVPQVHALEKQYLFIGKLNYWPVIHILMGTSGKLSPHIDRNIPGNHKLLASHDNFATDFILSLGSKVTWTFYFFHRNCNWVGRFFRTLHELVVSWYLFGRAYYPW